MPASPPTKVVQNTRGLTPGETIQSEPWAFIGLALAGGLALGMALRFKPLRKALSLYFGLRRLF